MSEEANESVDVTSISDLEQQVTQVVDKVIETKRTIVIERDGEPVAAIVDFAEFQRVEELAEQVEILQSIIQAEQEAQ
jgi:prevent-host-death family protein